MCGSRSADLLADTCCQAFCRITPCSLEIVVASLAADGKLTAVSTIATAKGARNAVATEDGTAYVAVGPAGTILVLPPVH